MIGLSKSLIVLMLITMPAMAETFRDRWPEPVAVDSVLNSTVWPELEKKSEPKVRKPKTFVCHKQYYLKRGYRYWRCKR